MPTRNIHVFSSSGEEVAGESNDATLWKILVAKHTPGFSFSIVVCRLKPPSDEVSHISAAWTLYPYRDNRIVAGHALDRNSQDDLSSGSYVIRTGGFNRYLCVLLVAYSGETEVASFRVFDCRHTSHECAFCQLHPHTRPFCFTVTTKLSGHLTRTASLLGE